MINDPIDILSSQIVKSVKCAHCGRLHEFTSENWVTLYGGWEQVQKPKHYSRGASYQNTFGTKDQPKIACRENSCIIAVMGIGPSLL